MSASPPRKLQSVGSGYFQRRVLNLRVPLRRKKAMEAELLKSKTELMLLNNQLLEAVQKRLELSLELEAWKVNAKTTAPPCKSDTSIQIIPMTR